MESTQHRPSFPLKVYIINVAYFSIGRFYRAVIAELLLAGFLYNSYGL